MSDKFKTRILLLLMNMSSIWLISLILWFVTGFGILMSMMGSVNSMHYQLFVPSAFCLFMCVRDYQQMKRKDETCFTFPYFRCMIVIIAYKG